MLRFELISKTYHFSEGENLYINNITRYADNSVTIEWHKNGEIVTNKAELSRLNGEANSPEAYVQSR
jgi:hypothetical protein